MVKKIFSRVLPLTVIMFAFVSCEINPGKNMQMKTRELSIN